MANKVFRVPENISCLLLKQSYCRKVKKVCKHHIIFQRFEQQKRGVLWTVSKQAKDMKFKSRVTKLISSYLSFYGNGWKTHTKKIPFQLHQDVKSNQRHAKKSCQRLKPKKIFETAPCQRWAELVWCELSLVAILCNMYEWLQTRNE